MSKIPREVTVGAFVILAVAAVGYLAIRVDDRPFPKSSGKMYHVFLKSATGLISKSRVKMAGIKVGYIETITLHDFKAKATILVRKDLKLTTSTRVMLKSIGILGDKFIDIIPGNSEDPVLDDGAVLISDESIGTLDDLPGQIGSIANDLKDITSTVKNVLRGKGDPNLPFTKILSNILNATENLSMFAGRNRELMNVLVDNMVAFSENLNTLVGKVDDVNIGKMAKRLDNMLARLEKITKKMDEGQGTIGKLLNDDETIDEINTAVRSVNSLVAKSERLKTIVDINAEYLMQRRLTKNYISLSIQPKQDSFYHFQAIVDPGGSKTTVVEEVSQTGTGTAPYSGTTTVTKEVTDKNSLKFSAQFGKRFMDFIFKIGIFENTGGVSIDYLLFDDLVGFSFEAFDLGRAGTPHLKVRAKATFLKYFYALVGGDDLLGRKAEVRQDPSFFMGAGLTFTDDDIKSLIGVFSLL